MKIHMMKL